MAHRLEPVLTMKDEWSVELLQGGSCHSGSPHLYWYHGLTNIVDKLKEEIKEGWLLEAL
jgi:hypothetical protein